MGFAGCLLHELFSYNPTQMAERVWRNFTAQAQIVSNKAEEVAQELGRIYKDQRGEHLHLRRTKYCSKTQFSKLKKCKVNCFT